MIGDGVLGEANRRLAILEFENNALVALYLSATRFIILLQQINEHAFLFELIGDLQLVKILCLQAICFILIKFALIR